MAYGFQLGDNAGGAHGAGLGFVNFSSASSEEAVDRLDRSSIQQREFLASPPPSDIFRSNLSTFAASPSLSCYAAAARVPPVEAIFLRDHSIRRETLPSSNLLERSTTTRAAIDDRQDHHPSIPNLWDHAEASTSETRSGSDRGRLNPLPILPEAQLLPPAAPPHHLAGAAAIVSHDYINAEVPSNHPSASDGELLRIKQTTATASIVAATTSTTVATSVTCKECGNQAKKDCQFQRCRTCCKSRSFDCQTHVKSTWVPASHRRNRADVFDSSLLDESGTPRTAKRARGGGGGGGGGGFRLVAGSSISASSSGSQHDSETPLSAPSFGGRFPAEVRAQALFRCVKLTSLEDGEDEYAYQTTVRIGGHVFKGVLHDRGVDASLDSSSFAATSGLATSHHGLVAKSIAPTALLSDPAQAVSSATATLYGHLEDLKGVGGSNW